MLVKIIVMNIMRLRQINLGDNTDSALIDMQIDI